MLLTSVLTVLAWVPLALADFELLYPAPRNGEDDAERGYPCGGQAVSNNRTAVSTTGFPVALDMDDSRTVVQILLGVGNNPGDHFNVTLERTFQQVGEGAFCLQFVRIPNGVDVQDGTNATVQIISNGDRGGLYVCADITFASFTTQVFPSACRNSTGVTAYPLAANINANQSTADGQLANSTSTGQTSSSTTTITTGTSTGTSVAAATSATRTGQGMTLTVGWALIGCAALGVVVSL